MRRRDCSEFTKFKIPDINDGMTKSQLGLSEVINMPTLENGMGAILFCRELIAGCGFGE